MPRGGERPTCAIRGCGQPHKAQGRCAAHYQAHRLQQENPFCSVEGCRTRSLARGLCTMHYFRARNAGAFGPTCSIPGCGSGHHAQGLCTKHYRLEFRRRLREQGMACAVEGCGRSIRQAGLCRTHYERRCAGDSLERPIRRKAPPTERSAAVPQRAAAEPAVDPGQRRVPEVAHGDPKRGLPGGMGTGVLVRDGRGPREAGGEGGGVRRRKSGEETASERSAG
jgi:hypothetical protein